MPPTRLASAVTALALATLCCAPPALASILSDFNAGTIVTDFTFDDALSTQIPDLANSGTAPGQFDSDTDSEDVVANGAGQLDVSGKANTSFGSNYVDLPTISSGRAIALFDVSWSFDESVFDSAQDEEFRLTLITNDPRSTFVTAEIFFRRTSATEVTLFGNGVGTGSSDTPDTVLGSSGDLLTLIDVDLDADVFELWFSSDDGASFTSGGTGMLDPTRGIESIRLVLNEDFSDDSLLIDRFALSIPEPATALLVTLSCVTFLSGRRHG